jgi:DNA-binding response OmpR family regulator
LTDLVAQRRILVIDDEQMIQRLLKRFLEKRGFEVSCYSNGEEGVQSFRDNAVDLVITDLSMPGMDGVAVIEALRAIDAEVPIFVISGDPSGAHEQNLAQAAETGAIFVLAKPVQLKELASMIDAAVSEKED